MTLLSWTGFPHIVEEIVAHLDGQTMLSARLVNTEVCRLANRTLIARCARIEIRHRGQELVFVSNGGVLPFFHPSAPLDHQYAAMRRARTVIIGRGVPPGARLNDLLARLNPRARVRFEHAKNGSSHHVLPRLRYLELDVPAGCECSPGNYVPLQHQARNVRINILFQDYQQRPTCMCGLVRGLVHEGVERLEIHHWNHDITSEDLFLRQVLCADANFRSINTTRELFRFGVQQVSWVTYRVERRSPRATVSTRTIAAAEPAKSPSALAAPTGRPSVRYTLGQAVSSDHPPDVSNPQFRHYTRSTAILTFAFFFVTLVAARSSRK